ncbi:MAG: DUF3343 domain-containing protein [Spirochaetes bacterium]|nr:DUF3343 domain-containing protein [Spirochaetota bacterium]
MAGKPKEYSPETEALVCLQSVSQAILAEQLLCEHEFYVKIMPTPAGIQGGCGFCLRFLAQELEAACDFLSRHGIPAAETYLAEGAPGAAAYRKICVNIEGK